MLVYDDPEVSRLRRELEEAKEAILVLANEIKFLKGELKLLKQELEQKS